LQARDLIFSVVGEESGKDCGKVQTLLLKVSFVLLSVLTKDGK
jgi:hypothetical protein